MGIEAGIAKFGDLLGQKFYPVGGITEDNGLVDLEFGEEGIEAMDLLLFLHESIILCDSPKREFIHKIDFVGVGHVVILVPLVSLGYSARRIRHTLNDLTTIGKVAEKSMT